MYHLVLMLTVLAAPAQPTSSSMQPNVKPGRAPAVAWKRNMAPRIPLLVPPPLLPVEPPVMPAVIRAMSAIPAGANPEPESVNRGASRAATIRKLGKPRYCIVMGDGGHSIERCRFEQNNRAAVTAVEFQDGMVREVIR